MLVDVARCAACLEPMRPTAESYVCCRTVPRGQLDELVLRQLMDTSTFTRLSRARARAFHALRGSTSAGLPATRQRARQRLDEWSWSQLAWLEWDQWTPEQRNRWVSLLVSVVWVRPDKEPQLEWRV